MFMRTFIISMSIFNHILSGDLTCHKKRHQKQIITKLNIEGQVFGERMVSSFGVTEDCIRKDLTLLEKLEKLKRVHGGAINARVNLHHQMSHNV